MMDIGVPRVGIRAKITIARVPFSATKRVEIP